MYAMSVKVYCLFFFRGLLDVYLSRSVIYYLFILKVNYLLITCLCICLWGYMYNICLLLACLFIFVFEGCYLSTYLFRSFRVIGCVFVLERMKVLVFEVRHIKLLISRTCYMKGTWNSLIQKTISNKTNNHSDSCMLLGH
jgi:hypothetical protein